MSAAAKLRPPCSIRKDEMIDSEAPDRWRLWGASPKSAGIPLHLRECSNDWDGFRTIVGRFAPPRSMVRLRRPAGCTGPGIPSCEGEWSAVGCASTGTIGTPQHQRYISERRQRPEKVRVRNSMSFTARDNCVVHCCPLPGSHNFPGSRFQLVGRRPRSPFGGCARLTRIFLQSECVASIVRIGRDMRIDQRQMSCFPWFCRTRWTAQSSAPWCSPSGVRRELPIKCRTPDLLHVAESSEASSHRPMTSSPSSLGYRSSPG